MSHEHTATIRWKLTSPDFLRGKYSREHTWTFDGGATIPASPAPSVVPAPWSNPAHVDPEEAFVASVASCHMLTFLWLAGRAGFVVETYEDTAAGTMSKDARGVPWVSTITLRPRIGWSAEKVPAPDELAKLHHTAHEQCFIANSIKTEVTVAPPAA
ncbi:MAG: OsmC family protein [Chthoniobacteraceae bacterium]